MNENINPEIAIQNLNSQLNKALGRYSEWVETGIDWEDPEWLIESCFFQLLSITEHLGLVELRKMVFEEYSDIKSSKGGLKASGLDPDGDPYSKSLSRIGCYLLALEHLFPGDEDTTVTKDLLQIIRDIHYSITDTTVFASPPANEADVHNRIEAILKCVFPDLRRKPSLSKQIKNFEPDTGIPSLRTLIEYKFLNSKQSVGTIADQVLADTRGYTSKDWSKFIYVIYETRRYKQERDWNIFLQESGVPKNTVAVVLSGTPATQTRNKKKASKKKTAKKAPTKK